MSSVIESYVFGPGRYFIGDICYALPDKIYDEFWGDIHNYECGMYDIFAVHSTAYGDGIYLGTDAVEYSVDAGVIGVTDISEEQRYDDKKLNSLGKIVDVKDKLIMEVDGDGTFTFTVDGEQFEIITGDINYEDE